MSDAVSFLEQVYVWLPSAFLVDFLVIGTIGVFARRKYRKRGEAHARSGHTS